MELLINIMVYVSVSEGESGIKSFAELRLEVVKGGARPNAETGRGCQAATLFLNNYFSTD